MVVRSTKDQEEDIDFLEEEVRMEIDFCVEWKRL
jgi:hypothetical protein